MFKLLSSLGGIAVLAMILFGTWPLILGKPPVKPLVKPSQAERVKDAIATADTPDTPAFQLYSLLSIESLKRAVA